MFLSFCFHIFINFHSLSFSVKLNNCITLLFSPDFRFLTSFPMSSSAILRSHDCGSASHVNMAAAVSSEHFNNLQLLLKVLIHHISTRFKLSAFNRKRDLSLFFLQFLLMNIRKSLNQPASIASVSPTRCAKSSFTSKYERFISYMHGYIKRVQ